MRIVFIRHGDPDYTNDTLTEKGRKEAALLAENIGYLELEDAEFYVSPLGRARDTAGYVLDKLGKSAVTMDWLQEFPAQVDVNGNPEFLKIYPDTGKQGDKYSSHIAWDMVPAYWTEQDDLGDLKDWKNAEVVKHSDIQEVYERVTKAFDELLAEYGYAGGYDEESARLEAERLAAEEAARTAAENGQLAARKDVIGAGGCRCGIVGTGKRRARVDKIDAVMWDSVHLLRCWLSRTDGEIFVDLHGVT